jgi:diguanylate cyclase (GGDEF)-like protein
VSAAEFARVISLVGLGVQAAGAVLLAILFALLVRAGETRPYFRAWAAAWAALALALASVSAWFAIGGAGPVPIVLLAAYQGGKSVFFLLLLAGARLFVRSGLRIPAGRLGVTGALLFAGVSMLLTEDVGALMAVQALVAVPCLVSSTVSLLRVAPARRSFGVIATAVALGCLAALWMLYLVLRAVAHTPGEGALGVVAALLHAYNAYVDLLLQTMLGFGMVLIASEEAHRELADAHRELGYAHEQLRADSLRDSLTGALNRRAFSDLSPLEQVLEGGGTVVVVDFDDFKAINDEHGHAAGDAMLRHFVDELREKLREGDLLYRLGGDEFLVVVPGASPERLEPRFADGIAAMAPLALEPGGETIPVKVSWGLAAFDDSDDLARAVRAADAHMYERKRTVQPDQASISRNA